MGKILFVKPILVKEFNVFFYGIEVLANHVFFKSFYIDISIGLEKIRMYVWGTLDGWTPNTYVLVICHTPKLCEQIQTEYKIFSKHLPQLQICSFTDEIESEQNPLRASIVIGTPDHIFGLINAKKINITNMKYFILEECDKMLEQSS